MIILVDQDNVLADFEQGWTQRWRSTYPDAPFVPPEQRTSFEIKEQYPSKWHPQMDELRNAASFFRTLPPVAGAAEGMDALRDAGHHVLICTSPLTRWENCVAEKYGWIEEHLGTDWVRRTILTKDKTLVRGDVLIDDKPHVTGVLTPTWTHIRFEQPYNVGIPGPRLTWANAVDVVTEVEQALRRTA